MAPSEERGVKTSSSVLDRAFSETKRLCYAGLDEATLLRGVTQSVQRVVPLDAHCAHTNDPASGLITRAFPSVTEIERGTPEFLERIYFEDEVTPFGWMAKRRLSALSLSEATGGRPERALRYREGMARMGFGYEVRGVFAVNGRIWGSVSAMREPSSHDFDARELGFFRRIAPHVAAGLKAAVLRSEALAEPRGEDSPGVVVLDHAGRVVQHTRTARRWLGEMGELGREWREDDGLPPAILSLAGALRRSLGGGSYREANGVPRLLVRAHSGRWLALHGVRTEPGSSRGNETMIVIEPAGPREVAWLKTSAYGLSDREREVVDLVARGLSTKEISKTLYVSDYTIQEHLSHVFEKVGVRGRRALVKHLYLDSFL